MNGDLLALFAGQGGLMAAQCYWAFAPSTGLVIHTQLHEGLKRFSESAECHTVLHFSPTNGHLGGVCQEFHLLTVVLLVEVLQNQLIQM